MRVHIATRDDVIGCLADRLPVLDHILAPGDRAQRDLVAKGHGLEQLQGKAAPVTLRHGHDITGLQLIQRRGHAVTQMHPDGSLAHAVLFLACACCALLLAWGHQMPLGQVRSCCTGRTAKLRH